jgi:MFS transporter, DHA1 family, inner membrane transport protein
MPLIVWLFSLINLVIGTSAFVVGGIVHVLSRDLGVSVAQAGQAMTAYALSTALLAPVALVATGRLSRKNALLLALCVFLSGNTLMALAPSMTVVMLGRVLMGIGAFFTPLAAALVVGLVDPAQRGKALSFVFLGMSMSYVVGVPLGAWVADTHGWRWAIGLMSMLQVICVVVVAAQVPRMLSGPSASFKGTGALLANPSVSLVLLVSLMYFTAIFVVFSYIGAVLRAMVPMSSSQVSLTLSLFGVAGVVGTLVGGYVNDRFGAHRSLWVSLSVMGVAMLLLPLTRGSWPAMLSVLFAWGVAGFALMPAQQARLSAAAGPQTPLVLSLNASMLYLGTAVGALVGGLCVDWLTPARLSYAGVPFIGLAVAFHAASVAVRRKVRPAVA